MVYSARATKSHEEVTMYGLLGERRSVRKVVWRVTIQLTRNPSSSYLSTKSYKTFESAHRAAKRIVAENATHA